MWYKWNLRNYSFLHWILWNGRYDGNLLVCFFQCSQTAICFFWFARQGANYPETLGSDISLLAPWHLILCSIVRHFVLDGGSFCAPQFLILCFTVASSSLKFDAVEPKILHARVHYYIVGGQKLGFYPPICILGRILRGERVGCGLFCRGIQDFSGELYFILDYRLYFAKVTIFFDMINLIKDFRELKMLIIMLRMIIEFRCKDTTSFARKQEKRCPWS